MAGQGGSDETGSRDDAGRRRTARIAVLAGLPGLAMTALAAATSTALTLKADLALTLLDMVALLAAWRLAGPGPRDPRREALVSALVALSMTLSMAAVASIAAGRIAAGGMAPSGTGAVFGMALNLAYAVVNGWILVAWRRRHRARPCRLSRSQVCLFADKLCSNILIGGSIGAAMLLEGDAVAAYLDPLAGLLIAAATARWTLPVMRDAVAGLRAGGWTAGATARP